MLSVARRVGVEVDMVVDVDVGVGVGVSVGALQMWVRCMVTDVSGGMWVLAKV